MPESPFQRAAREGAGIPQGSQGQGPKGSSSAGGKKRKRKSRPTTSARARKQRTKDRYAHAREDAQLEGLIPTLPEEALKPEQVPACAQSEDRKALAEMVTRAIRGGWAVPLAKREQFVEELTGILLDPEESSKVKVAAFTALRLADHDQWVRDNPEVAGKAKGGTSGVSLQVNIQAAQVVREMIESGEFESIGNDTHTESVSAPEESGASGGGGFAREMEAPTPSSGNQQRVNGSMAHPKQ